MPCGRSIRDEADCARLFRGLKSAGTYIPTWYRPRARSQMRVHIPSVQRYGLSKAPLPGVLRVSSCISGTHVLSAGSREPASLSTQLHLWSAGSIGACAAAAPSKVSNRHGVQEVRVRKVGGVGGLARTRARRALDPRLSIRRANGSECEGKEERMGGRAFSCTENIQGHHRERYNSSTGTGS